MCDTLLKDFCTECGTELPVDQRSTWRRFCSKRCNNAYFNGLTAAARAEARAMLLCRRCGVPIENAKRAHRQFCSRRCQRQASRRGD